MRISVGTSSAKDADAAIAEALGAIDPAPDFLMACFAEGVGANRVAEAARRLSPGALHGGTSCRGVLASRVGAGSSRPRIGAFAIHDRDGDYGTAAAPKGGDARAAARSALAAALAAAGRTGEAPDLVWLTATPGSEEEIVAGLADLCGPATPIVGGSAADDRVAGAWRIVGPTGPAMNDGLVVTAMFPSAPVSLAFQNGYAPTGHAGRATMVDGRRLLAIDGRPAAEVYAEWTGRPPWLDERREGVSILAESTFFPLGRPASAVSGVPLYVLSHPAALAPGRTLDLFANVEAGETLCLMEGSPDSLAARAGRVVRQAMAARGDLSEIAGAIVIYCGGCMLAVEDRLDAISEGVAQALGEAPFLGAFTFGEQGPVTDGTNRHANLMVSCVVFGARGPPATDRQR